MRWSHRNPERMKELRRDYYYRHRKKILLEQREARNIDIRKRMLIDSSRTAKEKGLLHNISLDDIRIPSMCPVFNKRWDEDQYKPSLDRIDNSKGYEVGNVQVISLLANQMKRNATPTQLKQFAEWINRCVTS